MLQFHYNIPKGSFNTILEEIINHLTPKGNGEYERIAEGELKEPKRLLLDNSGKRRQIMLSWTLGGMLALGLKLFDTEATKECAQKLTNERYTPPSSRYGEVDYIMAIVGYEVDYGQKPLTVIISRDARNCKPNDELLEYSRIVQESGFAFARRLMQEMGRLNKLKLKIPATEEEFKEMLKDDELRVYTERLMTDIQVTRFFWDFFGRPIETAGYLPECIEGNELKSMQPALKEDLELITAYPTIPLEKVTEEIIGKMVGDFTAFGVSAALRAKQDLPEPEYKRRG